MDKHRDTKSNIEGSVIGSYPGTGGQLNGVIWTLDEEHHFNERPKRGLAAGTDPLTGIPTGVWLTQLKPELSIQG